jgi:hypothetical protein
MRWSLQAIMSIGRPQPEPHPSEVWKEEALVQEPLAPPDSASAWRVDAPQPYSGESRSAAE